MNDETLKQLLEQYLTGSITADEKKKLARLIDQSMYREKLEAFMEEAFKSDAYEGEGNGKLHGEIQEWLKQKIAENGGAVAVELPRERKKSLLLFKGWQRFAVAASIILIAGIFLYQWQSNKQNTLPTETASTAKLNNSVPGKHKAKLRLADGSIIILDSAVNGKLTRQGNADVINRDGKLIYEQTDSGETEVLYNSLFTSNGETYAMILADGTKVWLNAQGSIKFPNSFPGKERRVEITGEAYFEVEHNPAKPFHVTANGMEVQVLGTRFNINAYVDEPNITTTLVEGKVKVSKDGATGLLSPRSQAVITGKNNLKILKNVNTDPVIAWKEGLFNFDQMELKEFLRQFARWYDVEVIYQTDIPEKRLFGIMNRNSSLSSVLAALNANNIKFRLEGKKLIVTQ